MFPVYRYMDPYYRTFPHQTEPNSYYCQYYPGWETMPQTKADAFKNPSVFVPSPSDNMCQPNSGCCHHSCSPGHYNIRPQFSHVQPPPQVYFYGPYPPYPDAYPSYFVPPPRYSVDQARYDYDKARNHCCGCPNHSCHPRDDSSPKIEDRKPEKEQGGDSVGLIRLPNYPSPVVWVPTNSSKDREDDKAAQLQPGCWNGWIPLDINDIKGSRQEDEGKKGRQDEDKWSPFPIIWMPGYDKPEGPVKDLKDVTPKSVEDWPSKFKIVPLKLLENENDGERSKSVQEEPKRQVWHEAPVEKESKTKTIPVKQIEEISQKKADIHEKQEEKVDEKKATSSEKLKKESEVSKASEKKQSAPVKTSNLRPVCLRVDPLPRKKTTNGKSRSPSPPSHKDKKNEQHNGEQSPRIEAREEISEKVIPVAVKGVISGQQDKERKLQQNVSVASVEDSSKETSVQETARGDDTLKAKEATEGSKIGEKDSEESMSATVGSKQNREMDKGHVESSESKEVKENKGRKRNLSKTDAAVIIQSAYRGFEVRKWHPLEKLQKIAKVREQAGNLRKQIQSIEASSKEWDAKERVLIGETIMSLLLELDTIQGLHPSVREVRKSVARELVCLQEELDSLGSEIVQEHKLANVEGETKATDDEAFFIGSEVDEHPSLEDKIDSGGSAASEERVVHDSDLIDLPPNDDAVVASPSFSRVPSPKLEAMQPAEKSSVTAELTFENVETDRSDNETVIVARPSFASETASDEGRNLCLGIELPCGLVQPAKENRASEYPSSENKKSDSKLESVEDTAREESAATESDGFSNAFLLPRDGPCEKEESVNTLACTAEEIGKWSSEDAVPHPDTEDLVELLADSKHQEREAAQVDYGAEDEAIFHHMLEEPSAQHFDQGRDLGQVGLLRAEDGKLALDAGEYLVIEEDKREPEMMSSLNDHEGGQNAEVDLPMLPLVDDSYCMSMPVRVEDGDSKDIFCPEFAKEVDSLKETMLENLEVLATKDRNCTAGVTEGDSENGLKVFSEEIESLVEDVLLPADKDAINEADQTPVVGEEIHALVLNEGSSASPGPALGPISKEAEDPNQTDEWSAPRNTSGDTKKETRMLEENERQIEKRMLEENERLRDVLEKLLEAGKEQLGVISNLNGRVKDLERQLAQKKRRTKVKRNKPVRLHSCEVSG